MAVLSRRWPFYQGRSSQVARHPDFGRGLQSLYYPAQSVYQRPGQAIFSKSRANGRFINARPNGRFIKAEATGWPDLQISATNCNFGIIPHNQFISGRTKLFSAKAGPMAVLSTRGPMAVFSKQKQPDGQTQISATNCIFASIPHNQFSRLKSFLGKTAIGGLPGLAKTAIGFDKAASALDKTPSCIRALEEAL